MSDQFPQGAAAPTVLGAHFTTPSTSPENHLATSPDQAQASPPDFSPGFSPASVSPQASPPILPPSPPSDLPREQGRHLLLGTPGYIRATIAQLHQLGYAEPNDWSRLLPTGRTNEVMAILTKRISLA